MIRPTTVQRRILIVEDDEPSRAALQSLLREEGFEVRVASDGDEGVSLARTFNPDVILMDLVLPRLNGFDAADLLKRDSETCAIPLVAVTASWIGSEADRLREIGFDSALRKPFPPDTLVDTLWRVLEH